MRRAVGGVMLVIGVLMLSPLVALAATAASSGHTVIAVVAPAVPFMLGAYGLVAVALLASGLVVWRQQ